MIVCIAEKPAVAKNIASVLGATHSCQGYMEGNGYQVTWTFGHLCELKEPHEYNDLWRRWDIWDLPLIPQRFGIRLIEDDGYKRQFAVIERLMQAADMIINCGDAGQEGELIQRWVMQKAKVTCPVKRLWVSSMTEEAIREAFDNLKDQSEYQSLYEAALARAIGDWTLGMNATRLYTIKYSQQRGQVLSIGRVQTPTLALIVARQHEIETFEPRQSWLLNTVYRDTKFSAISHDEDAEAEAEAEVKEAAAQGKTIKPKGPIYRQIEFVTAEEAQAVLDSITGNPFTVVDIQKRKGTEAPPRLYDLTSLQVDCNKKFGYSADLTLQLIQSLYEKKYTTYPRVDTTYLSDDIYPKCPTILNGLTAYRDLVAPLSGRPLNKSKKVFDTSKVTDHHAIIPTGVPVQGLTDMEKRVYDLVARAFIAVFYPDCKFETTTVFGKVERLGVASDADENERIVLFRTNSRHTIDQGWKVVFKSDEATQQVQEETDGVQFGKGESGPHEPSLQEKWTQPPKPYTQATLLRAMETAGKFVDSDELREALKENGIGRPSTRAAIIQTLFKRNYIRQERKNLIATPTGVDLIGIIHEELLKSAELTGIWEKKLRDIEHHKYETRQFIDELKQMVTEIVGTVRSDHSNRMVSVVAEPEPEAKKKSRRKGGDSTAAAASPAPSPDSPTTPSSGNAPAGFQPKKKRAKKQEKTPSPSATPVSAANFDTDSWVGMKCPVCGQGTIIKGHVAYGCSRWREGCTYRMPFEQNNAGTTTNKE